MRGQKMAEGVGGGAGRRLTLGSVGRRDVGSGSVLLDQLSKAGDGVLDVLLR